MASCPSDPSANHPSHSRNEPITSPFPIVTTYNIVSQPSRHHQSMHFQFRSRCGLICITTADNPSVRRTKPPIYRGDFQASSINHRYLHPPSNSDASPLTRAVHHTKSITT
eukprot:640720_1